MRFLLPLLLLSLPAQAQEFLDETDLRFPQPNPKEYSNQVDLADVDNDGDLDIFFANGKGFSKPQAPEQSRLYINNGNGQFTDETQARLGLPPAYMRDGDFGDLNGDGWVDLLVAGAFGDPPHLLLNNGDGSFTDVSAVHLPLHDGSWGASICLADVDMDGDLDAYLTNAGEAMFKAPGGQDKLWLNDGAGLFTDVTDEQLPSLVTRATLHAEFADIDLDGDLDIVVGNREVKNNLLINNGYGFFSDESVLLDPDGTLSQSVGSGDLDGDGLPDLVVINGNPKKMGNQPGNQELVLINGLDGGKGFVDLTSFLLTDGANPVADDSRFVFIDVDHDQDYDLIIAALSPGSERLLINDGKGVLSAAPAGTFKGPIDATLDLAVGDVNGDGRPDVVTAQGESGNFQNRLYISKGAVDSLPPRIDHVGPIRGVVPYIGPVVIVARIRDSAHGESGPQLSWVKLNGSGMQWAGGNLYRGQLGSGLISEQLTASVSAQDQNKNKATSDSLSLMPRHPLDVFPDGVVDDNDLNIMIDHLVDKGGLDEAGDINGDGVVDLTDAQLLASGLGGYPILSRRAPAGSLGTLLIGANFGASPKVSVSGVNAPVSESSPFSLICASPEAGGVFQVDAGGTLSNALQVTP
jgi:hypothetical protein